MKNKDVSETVPNYRKTLNLPRTSFAMKASLAQNEPLRLAAWKEKDVYGVVRRQSEGRPPYILHDGPPYANGHIHIGHALNKILKDIVVRMKTMQGYDALFVPGWDCHGLPIEHQLFKTLKKKKSEVDPLAFRREAHDYALKFVQTQKGEFIRLGVMGEWEHPYLTLDPEYEYWILKSLAGLNERGYIEQGVKPVNWCVNCETALAEAEVEYADHTSPSIFVKFPISNPDVLPGWASDKPAFLLIWTTTPWTLPANVAVAVHDEFVYGAFERSDEVLIVEKSRQAGGEVPGLEPARLIGEWKGASLTRLAYDHPLGMRTSCPVIAMPYVSREEGTGLVHTAPGHGQDDFEAGRRYHLDVVMPVNDRGYFDPDTPHVGGQRVFEANPKIIEILKQQALLLAEDKIAHSYPHCWRCRQPVIFRATRQWFLKIDHENLRTRLLEAVEKEVAWVPPAGRERISAMISTRPDWCLSRQRHWGVPIPALKCRGCGGIPKLFSLVIDRFAERVRTAGSTIWFERPVEDWIPDGFVCPDCQGRDFEATSDILDVWFDSGVSHQAVVEPMMHRSLPVDLYLEGSDQHRGWFQSSLIPAVALTGRPPYKAVLTHGFVVDGEGRKMSKSLGNVITPQTIMQHHGADILRLWVASSQYQEDVRLSQEILDRLIDAYRKIRNTLRYLLGNLDGFDLKAHGCEVASCLPLDRWALARWALTAESMRDDFERFDFPRAMKTVFQFCNEDLSSFYLDIIKDRLYTSAAFSPERRSAQTALFYIADGLIRMLAPVLVFTADEAYEALPLPSSQTRAVSVHALCWPQTPPEWKHQEVLAQYEPVLALRPHVLRAIEEQRAAGRVGSSLEARVTLTVTDEKEAVVWKGMEDELASIFIVSQVDVRQAAGEAAKKGPCGRFPATRIVVERAQGEKCARCWVYRQDVGEEEKHPHLCRRCAGVVRAFMQDA